jgi:glycosyltransferase involved in cell wall biosynthesis
MRILYTCHQFLPDAYTGTEQYTLGLARQLQKMGHHVSVLTYSIRGFQAQPTAGSGILRSRYEYEGVPVIALRHADLDSRGGLPGISFELENPLVFQEIQQLFCEQPFDLLHCVHPMRTGEAIRAAKEKGMKIVLHLMDYWMICPRVTLQCVNGSLCSGPDRGRNCVTLCYQGDGMDERLLKRYVDNVKSLRAVDAILSHSRFLIDVFKEGGIDTGGFFHCRNGFDYEKCHFRKSGRDKADPINFGFIGTVLPHKGVEVLIDAFKEVASGNIRLKIYGGHFGEVEYHSRIAQKAEEDKRIEFCGTYDFNSLSHVLEGIDVVVVPSLWYENAPLVIGAAQACGIPVIATRLGGMKEMVVDAVNGITFQLGDKNDLADKIRLIAANPSILTELSRNKIPPPRVESEAFLLERLYSDLLKESSWWL